MKFTCESENLDFAPLSPVALRPCIWLCLCLFVFRFAFTFIIIVFESLSECKSFLGLVA